MAFLCPMRDNLRLTDCDPVIRSLPNRQKYSIVLYWHNTRSAEELFFPFSFRILLVDESMSIRPQVAFLGFRAVSNDWESDEFLVGNHVLTMRLMFRSVTDFVGRGRG
jgi:hypothetical protein